MHKKWVKKSQTSMEFMIIFGFVALAIIPLLAVYYTQTKAASDTIISAQAQQIARHITDNAETVYYLGPPSKTTLRVLIPEHVESIDILNNEIVFNIMTGASISEVVSSSKVNITGAISASPGIRRIVIEAKEGYVMISG